jgi:PhoH-like ATPase
MNKVYILDTSVLLHDPRAIYAFQDNEVIIPAVVIEEIDGKKRLQDDLGRNARKISRILDNLRKQGPLHVGVTLETGGVLRVELNHKSFVILQEHFYEVNNDNRIIAVAYNIFLEEKEKGRPVILVSQDVILRIKADALGIKAEDYYNDKLVPATDLYMGFLELLVKPELINQYYQQQGLEGRELVVADEFYPNQFILLKDSYGSNQSALGIYDSKYKRIRPLKNVPDHVWGIVPRNVQQKMALEILLNDEIQLVTLTGKAGTGKTLLALAAGLNKTQDERHYKKLLVARPVIPMGRDLGYLPGDKEDKLRPWMQPIYDNLEYLFNIKNGNSIEDILVGIKNIQVEALTYIRGRSIPQQLIIIDEAQNLTKHEVKTIISRVGEESKIILVGDPEQIDHPYMDSTNNGLTYVVEKFKEQGIAGHVTLIKGERSALAQLAADLL